MTNEPGYDKTGWGEGEWQHEPDRVDFYDQDSGYHCLIRRGPLGSLNGYVGVPFGHPAYGLTYFNDKLDHLRVHGGLTYSGGTTEEATEECPTYWHGFDCGHAWDLCPKLAYLSGFSDGSSYRNLTYVKAEVLSLAKQLKDMETCDPS